LATVETKKTEIQFNERTIEAFSKEGLDPPSGELARKERNDKFRSKFNQEKGVLQVIIKTMHRRPVKTFDKSGKAIMKDYLTYQVEYRGHDWLGNPIQVLDNIEGVYIKPKFRNTTSINPETGEHVVKKEYAGHTEEYYIELTDKNRKKIIQDIINKCNGTVIDEILFYYHVPASSKGLSFRCNIYTYDQFINSSMDELEKLARTTPSPVNYLIKNKDQKSYMG
jgi:hypothetical protein